MRCTLLATPGFLLLKSSIKSDGRVINMALVTFASVAACSISIKGTAWGNARDHIDLWEMTSGAPRDLPGIGPYG